VPESSPLGFVLAARSDWRPWRDFGMTFGTGSERSLAALQHEQNQLTPDWSGVSALAILAASVPKINHTNVPTNAAAH
jgi:hypothetical protein